MLQEFRLKGNQSVFCFHVASSTKRNQIAGLISLRVIAVKFAKRLYMMDRKRLAISVPFVLLVAMLTGVIVPLADSARNFTPLRAISSEGGRAAFPARVIGLFKISILTLPRTEATSTRLHPRGDYLKWFTATFALQCNTVAKTCALAFGAAITMDFSSMGISPNWLAAISAMSIRLFLQIRTATSAMAKVMRPDIGGFNLFGFTAVGTVNRNGHVASPVMRPDFGVGGWSGNQPCQRVIKPLKPIQIIP